MPRTLSAYSLSARTRRSLYKLTLEQDPSLGKAFNNAIILTMAPALALLAGAARFDSLALLLIGVAGCSAGVGIFRRDAEQRLAALRKGRLFGVPAMVQLATLTSAAGVPTTPASKCNTPDASRRSPSDINPGRKRVTYYNLKLPGRMIGKIPSK
jgi:hypothetical protein